MTYSSANVYAANRQFARNSNATKFKGELWRIGPISNAIFLAVLLCLIGLIYLTQSTKTNSLGYKIEGLKQAQSELSSEYDALTVESARLKNIDRIKSSPVIGALTVNNGN